MALLADEVEPGGRLMTAQARLALREVDHAVAAVADLRAGQSVFGTLSRKMRSDTDTSAAEATHISQRATPALAASATPRNIKDRLALTASRIP